MIRLTSWNAKSRHILYQTRCRPETSRAAAKNYAMMAHSADRLGHFIHFAAPSEPFTPASLTLYDEMRAAQGKTLMAGAAAKKGLYA